MDDELRARCARVLGMRYEEVTEVVETADGVVATLHDGSRALVRDDDTFEFGADVPEVAAAEEADAQAQTTDGVPDGAMAEVLEWVGEDRDRAHRALAVETAKDKPRTTLVAALEQRLADTPPAE